MLEMPSTRDFFILPIQSTVTPLPQKLMEQERDTLTLELLATAS